MENIESINTRVIKTIDEFLYINGNKLNNPELFDTQIIAVTSHRVFRETRDVSNSQTVELPNHPHLNYSVNTDPGSVIAVGVGFYIVKASKVRPVEDDYFTKWHPRYGDVIPTALDLTIFTQDCDLLEEQIEIVSSNNSYRLTDYFYELDIYQDARSRVTDEHSLLDELILQLA